MKSRLLQTSLICSLLVAITSTAPAQILADFYSSQTSQTPATAAAFIADGISVPTMTSVSAFNLLGSAQQLTSVTSNDGKLTATVSAGSAYQFTSDQFVQSDPLYDDGALTFSTDTLTISGLATDGLAANTTYTLYLQGSYYTAVSGPAGDFNLSYSYGTQSGGPTDPTGGNGFGSAKFTFTTGAVPLDTINLTIAKATSDSVPYPAITSFAIVATPAPEPSSWALLAFGVGGLLLIVRARRRA